MKRVAVLFSWVVVLVFLFSVDSYSQKKAKPRKKNNRTKVVKDTLPTVVEPTIVVNQIDTAAFNDSLTRANLIPKPMVAMRPGTTVEGNLVADKIPLAYDVIRVDDQVYRQILWRDINVGEKMNATFRYEGEENDGNQSFFYILLQHIRDGDLTAFDAVNDRFTTVLKVGDISKSMTGGSQTIAIPDQELDPDGTKGLFRDTTIFEEFDINSIVAYRVKQEIIFDRETSTLQFRTLGIAPLKAKDIVGVKAFIPMFWVYYPDARPFLARHEAYNPKNMAMRMSWEEIFEKRYYASTIYKTTLNNSKDMPLSVYVQDPLHRLWVGEDMKNEIFNWEQDQWSY